MSKRQIIVNGRSHQIDARSLNYDALLFLAYKNPGATVVGRTREGRSFEMVKGDVVIVGEGMVFNVVHTSAA